MSSEPQNSPASRLPAPGTPAPNSPALNPIALNPIAPNPIAPNTMAANLGGPDRQNALSPGVPDADRHDLIESCQGLVRNIAWKIHRKLTRTVELDDLIGYGQVGLVQAAAAFDPSRGMQFTTYCYHRIRGAILDGLSEMAWFSKADLHGSKYEEMAQDVMELDASQETDAGASTLSAEVSWFANLTSSLSIAYLAGGERAGAQRAEQDADDSPLAEAIDQEIAERLRKLVDALPGEAGELIRGTYFEGMSLSNIAKRLGISKAWVSRLHAKTLQRLARSLRLLAAGEE